MRNWPSVRILILNNLFSFILAIIHLFIISALSDNDVWAEGLLVFYEVFKFLETNVPEEILPKELYRTNAFEADLSYYLTEKWTDDYSPRPEVRKYLDHLESINLKEPLLLIAYVYHLYMGLLSGGQILQKKRDFKIKMGGQKEADDSNAGKKLTTFDGTTIAELKTKMRSNIDQMAEKFNETLKEELIEESKKVFELNNVLVRTIKDVDRVSYKQISFIIGLVILIWFFVKMLLPYT